MYIHRVAPPFADRLVFVLTSLFNFTRSYIYHVLILDIAQNLRESLEKSEDQCRALEHKVETIT